jgi:hypothetical protein
MSLNDVDKSRVLSHIFDDAVVLLIKGQIYDDVTDKTLRSGGFVLHVEETWCWLE